MADGTGLRPAFGSLVYLAAAAHDLFAGYEVHGENITALQHVRAVTMLPPPPKSPLFFIN